MFGYSIIATILSPSKNKQNQNNQKTNKTKQTKEKHPTTPYKTLEVKTKRLEITSIFQISTKSTQAPDSVHRRYDRFLPLGSTNDSNKVTPTCEMVRWSDFESQTYSIHEEISLTKQKVPGGR